MSLRLEIYGTDVHLVLRRNTVFFLTRENIISISFEISCIISIMMGEVMKRREKPLTRDTGNR